MSSINGVSDAPIGLAGPSHGKSTGRCALASRRDWCSVALEGGIGLSFTRHAHPLHLHCGKTDVNTPDVHIGAVKPVSVSHRIGPKLERHFDTIISERFGSGGRQKNDIS